MEIFLAKYCANFNCFFFIVEVGNIQPLFSSISEDFSFTWFSYKTIPLWSRRKTISLFQEGSLWQSILAQHCLFCFRKLGWRVGLQCVTGILVSLFFFGMFYRWPVFVFVSWCICFAVACLCALVYLCPFVLLSLCPYASIFVSLCLCVLASLCSRSPVKLKRFQICLTLSSTTKSNLAP